MSRALALIVAILALGLCAYVLGDDGMATCQIHHSFGVCYDALH